MCLFSLGTDTGGSTRQPASFCGVYGLKPSYGLVPRFGLISMTSSTDCIGIFGRSAADIAAVINLVKGEDGHDATCLAEIADISFSPEGVKGMRVGLPNEYFLDNLNPQVREIAMAQAKKLKEQGAIIEEVSLPYTKYGISVYYIITPAEISSNLAKFDGIAWGLSKDEADSLQTLYEESRGAGFGPETKRRIMLGTYALSAGYNDAYYKRAQAVRIKIVEDFKKAFERVDVLLTPTTPHPAFGVGEKVDDLLAMYLEDVFVTGASLAGLPAISVPAGKIGNLPLGVQIIGPKGQDAKVLAVAEGLS
jgi:aspartyl-tRNA(Asn)/glutamyl-tRNA(Gln) amidotransferase subunit A